MWLSAEEALRRLRVKPQTLYASVSRGRIRAKPDPARPAAQPLRREDVDRLARRAAGRRDRGGGRRRHPLGRSGAALGDFHHRRTAGCSTAARTRSGWPRRATLEDVAALLWEAAVRALRRRPACAADPPASRPLLRRDRRPRCHRSAELGRRPRRCTAEAVGSARDAGRRHLRAGRGPLHERLAAAWRRPRPPTRCAGRWCCSPTTSSTPRPSPPASPPRPARRWPPACCRASRR